jgi:cobalamin biosynthesis protein CobD/CbiB
MLENNNTGQVVISSKSDGYYKNGLRKFGDFLLGFFGILFVILFVSYLYVFISNTLNISDVLLSVIITVLVILAIWLLRSFFKNGRKFIAIGIISVPIIGLLVFGSCSMLLNGI